MCTFLVLLILAWLFAPLFHIILGVLALIFGPAIVAAFITNLLPFIPFWLAYFGSLISMIAFSWYDLNRYLPPVSPDSSYPATPFPPAPGVIDRLTLQPITRMGLPEGEREFIDGCMAIARGDDNSALFHLRNAADLTDGAFLAGLAAIKMSRFEEGARYLSSVANRTHELGTYISKYDLDITVRLPITDEIQTEVNPDMRGVVLALSQAYLKQERWMDALVQLQRLQRMAPRDTTTRLAMAEWLLKARPGDRDSCEEILRLTEGVESLSDLEAALLLDRARALRSLGRLREARSVLGWVLRSTGVRDRELLEAVRREKDSLKATK